MKYSFDNWRLPFGFALDRTLILVAVLWAVECWLVQNQTLKLDIGGDEEQLILRELKRGAIRFILDLLVAIACVNIFSGRVLVFLFVVSGLLSLGILTFYEYFSEPLTFSIASAQWLEGLDAGMAALSVAPTGWSWILLGFFILKVFLLKSGGTNGGRREALRKTGYIVCCCYVSVVTVLALVRPLSMLGSWHSFSYTGSLYGYTPTWFAELLFLDNDFVLLRANEALEKKSDKFRDVPLVAKDIRNLVIVQLESLDNRALDVDTIDGPLMPFLRSFRELAATIPIKPIHLTGSSDADFTLLLGAPPNGIIAPYKVSGFDFSGSIIGRARAEGFHTFAFHGNRGTFFSRRTAFREMGFDTMYMEEELKPAYSGVSKWGIPDDHVFFSASEALHGHRGAALALVISLTTHTPYTYLPEEQWKVFSDADTIEKRYFNSMRYLDGVLEEFVTALPHDSLLFLYSDHTSHVRYSLSSGGLPKLELEEFVPFFVYHRNMDRDLIQSGLQSVVPDMPTMVDVATYIHDHIVGR